MKRDRRLQALSSEHHHALVLARQLEAQVIAWDAVQGAALLDTFQRELEPHFQLEETLLLPALVLVGATDLADRTWREHAQLRQLVAEAALGNSTSLAAFSQALTAHVRFEERELFPVSESALPSDVLDEVARFAPKDAGGSRAFAVRSR